MKTIVTKKASDTIRLGKRFASHLASGDVVALVGELGSGKTTFTKGVAEGLGVKDSKRVNSPSFVIVKEYEGALPLYHFDLYRLKGKSALETTGYEEYFWGDGVCVIEWADKITDLLPEGHMRVEISFGKNEERAIKFVPKSSRYKKISEKMT